MANRRNKQPENPPNPTPDKQEMLEWAAFLYELYREHKAVQDLQRSRE